MRGDHERDDHDADDRHEGAAEVAEEEGEHAVPVVPEDGVDHLDVLGVLDAQDLDQDPVAGDPQLRPFEAGIGLRHPLGHAVRESVQVQNEPAHQRHPRDSDQRLAPREIEHAGRHHDRLHAERGDLREEEDECRGFREALAHVEIDAAQRHGPQVLLLQDDVGQDHLEPRVDELGEQDLRLVHHDPRPGLRQPDHQQDGPDDPRGKGIRSERPPRRKLRGVDKPERAQEDDQEERDAVLDHREHKRREDAHAEKHGPAPPEQERGRMLPYHGPQLAHAATSAPGRPAHLKNAARRRQCRWPTRPGRAGTAEAANSVFNGQTGNQRFTVTHVSFSIRSGTFRQKGRDDRGTPRPVRLLRNVDPRAHSDPHV